MSKRSVMMVGILFALMTFASVQSAFSKTVNPTPGNPLELSFAAMTPPSYPNSVLLQEWGKEIEKRSQGRVKFTFHFGGSLLEPAQTYSGIESGIAGAGWFVAGYTPGRFPLMETLELPPGFPSSKVGSRVLGDLYRKYQPKEFSKVHFLFGNVSGPCHIDTTKPVRSLQDMKGLRIRAMGGTAKIIEKLGGSSVGMPLSEAFQAIQKGVLDGVAQASNGLATGFMLGEILPYTSKCYLTNYTFYTVMNLKVWESLPDDIRKVFDDVSKEYQEEKVGKVWDQMDTDALKMAQEKWKHQVIALSPEELKRWSDLLKPIVDEWVKEKEPQGIPIKEVIGSMNDLREKYSKMFPSD